MAGLDRSTVLDTIERLDTAVAAIDGQGFTPDTVWPQSALAEAIGLDGAELWVKDETGNVSGCTRDATFFGVALGLALTETQPERLAIASCGNAAFAASVVAAAVDQPLEVFVPDWADQAITDRIAAHGATVVRTERDPDRLGDPAYHAMVDAMSPVRRHSHARAPIRPARSTAAERLPTRCSKPSATIASIVW